MIRTVTLNTALDITYSVRALRPHSSHRVTEVTERPGGKGLNVGRVLAALGHEVTVTGFTGGATGRTVRDQLTGTAGVVDALVPVEGSTRRTIAVVDAGTGDTTQLNEPGPAITAAEWSAFQETYEHLLRSASAVALCGSLPPGVPVGAYAQLVRTARTLAVPGGDHMAWTRRDFVKASALAIPAAAVPSTARAQQAGAPGSPAAAPPAPPVFTPLRRNVGIFHQRGGTDGHPT